LRCHFMVYSEKSPAKKLYYIEQPNLRELYGEYLQWFQGGSTVKFSTFRKIFFQVMKTPLVDPETAQQFAIYRRKRHAVGFAKCNVCSTLEFAILMAKNKVERDIARGKLKEHHVKIKADRQTLSMWRSACDGILKVGLSIDAADSNKFTTPTTKAKAKVLSGLKRIKNKITGVEMLGKTRRLWLFRTLPNVVTGSDPQTQSYSR